MSKFCRILNCSSHHLQHMQCIMPIQKATMSYAATVVRKNMLSVHINQYGADLQKQITINKGLMVPTLQNPDEILVRVKSASLNPIDIAMINGYGSNFFTIFKAFDGNLCETQPEFPVILGRDLCGEVIYAGPDVPKNLSSEGTSIIAAKYPFSASGGCLAEYAVVQAKHAVCKPENISDIEAAAVPYAALTAYSALKPAMPLQHKRVLIHGASGGVGIFAVQLCQAWLAGAVVATCRRPEAADLLTDLGAEPLMDLDDLPFNSFFDLIVDCVELSSKTSNQLVKNLSPGGKYVRLRTPLLQSGPNARKAILRDFVQGVTYGLFNPDGSRLAEIARLVESEQLLPVVQHVFPIEQTVAGFQALAKGPTLGKTVITVT